MSRKAGIKRKTKETDIEVSLDLDGSGSSEVKTPVNFFNHMLECLSKHSGIDIKVKAEGDVEIDTHHTVEDVGICLGRALEKALGDKKGIERMGYFIVPMDEAAATVAVDIGGRPYANVEIRFSDFTDRRIGDIDKQDVEEFLTALAANAKMNIYVKAEGRNDHHIIESVFKALAKALKGAIKVTGKDVPSTKGSI